MPPCLGGSSGSGQILPVLRCHTRKHDSTRIAPLDGHERHVLPVTQGALDSPQPEMVEAMQYDGVLPETLVILVEERL